MITQAIAEIADIVERQNGDALGAKLGRRLGRQLKEVLDIAQSFGVGDRESRILEQALPLRHGVVVDPAQRSSVEAGRRIRRVVGNDHGALQAAQPAQYAGNVRAILDDAQQRDRVSRGSLLLRKLASIEIADRSPLVACHQVRGQVAAAVGQKLLQRHLAAADVEDRRPGGDVLRGHLRP